MPEGVRENGERGGIGVTAKYLRSAITFIECCHWQSPRLRWGMREQAAICFYEVYYELQFERLTKTAVASYSYYVFGCEVTQNSSCTQIFRQLFQGPIAVFSRYWFISFLPHYIFEPTVPGHTNVVLKSSFFFSNSLPTDSLRSFRCGMLSI